MGWVGSIGQRRRQGKIIACSPIGHRQCCRAKKSVQSSILLINSDFEIVACGHGLFTWFCSEISLLHFSDTACGMEQPHFVRRSVRRVNSQLPVPNPSAARTPWPAASRETIWFAVRLAGLDPPLMRWPRPKKNGLVDNSTNMTYSLNC